MEVCSEREGERIVLDGNWEENIPGTAYPLPWKPKNGMCTEIPSPAANLGGFIPNKRLGGFVPAVLLSQDLSLGSWCLTGDTIPQVAPPWSLELLQQVWILDIQSLGAFLHGALGSAPKPRIFWVSQKPEGAPWSEPVEQSRLCHPSNGHGNGALGTLRLDLQQELGMPPSRGCPGVSCWVWDPEPPGCTR